MTGCKIINMRDETRCAVSDVALAMLASHGIVLSFDAIFQLSKAIDLQMVRIANQAMSWSCRNAKAVEDLPDVAIPADS
jgi:hypothetical protein